MSPADLALQREIAGDCPAAPAGARDRPAEWRRHLPLVLSAMMGFSLYSLMPYSFGLFMEPLGREFGWSRTQTSFSMMVPSILLILLSPGVGALVDRWGSRRIAVPCLALSALAIAAMSLAKGSTGQWLLLWAFYGTVNLGIATTVWTNAVSGAFSNGRGLALGLTLCGMALAQVVGPPLSRWLVDGFGWRAAFQWLGLGWGGPCLLLAILFFRDVGSRTTAGDGTSELTGLSLGEALRDPALLKLAASTLITMMIGTAVLVHQVPILTAAGATRTSAAWLASLAGATGILGKLLTGWMTDRWNASVVGAVSLAAPALGYVLLMDPGAAMAAKVGAMMIIGYASGTKMQICAFLTARYAGLRNYGKIFGVMTSIIGLAGSLGTVAAGAIFDASGSYGPLLVAGIVGSFASALLVLLLGPAPTRFSSRGKRP